jgi:hypothetical protein
MTRRTEFRLLQNLPWLTCHVVEASHLDAFPEREPMLGVSCTLIVGMTSLLKRLS